LRSTDDGSSIDPGGYRRRRVASSGDRGWKGEPPHRICHTRPVAEVGIHELRSRGGDVVDRAARGERITITRAGNAVAELRPVSHPPLAAETLLARWRGLPPLDPDALRADLREILDTSL
jgi:prevent-host-death family protein